MKTKTTAKKTKRGTTFKSDGLEPRITNLKNDFKELRADGDYYSLGQIFWDIFLLEDRKSKLYKTADKLWLSLSEDEQAMCEG